MGLAIKIGKLADLCQNNPEGAKSVEQALEKVNNLLVQNGLAEHAEALSLPDRSNRAKIMEFPYAYLHYLRRLAGNLAADTHWQPIPCPDDEDPAEDPVAYAEGSKLESHLLCHSDCEGFYVPVDFPEPLFDENEEVAGGILGSSPGLMRELLVVAAPLGIAVVGNKLSDSEAERILSRIDAGDPFKKELIVWIALFEASRLSVDNLTAICFG